MSTLGHPWPLFVITMQRNRRERDQRDDDEVEEPEPVREPAVAVAAHVRAVVRHEQDRQVRHRQRDHREDDRELGDLDRVEAGHRRSAHASTSITIHEIVNRGAPALWRYLPHSQPKNCATL